MENPLIKNSLHPAVIEGYSSEGLGVARVLGRAVFVAQGARGDEGIVRIVREGAPAYGIWEERTVLSPHGIESDCPAYPRCGGCNFRHVAYEEELWAKRARVSDALRRIGGVECPVEGVLPSPRVEGYRNKASFPVRDVGGRAETGFFRARSHELIPVRDCPLQPDTGLPQALTAWMERFGVPAYDEKTGVGLVRHLVIRTARNGQVLCCVSATQSALPHTEELLEALRAACPGLVGVVLDTNDRPGNRILSGRQKTLWGQAFLEEGMCGLTFTVSPLSFFQVNPAQAEALYDLAVAMAGGGGLVFDLYCGTGTLSLCLARCAGRVVGVEIVPEAVRDAEENARKNGLADKAQFTCADAADFAARWDGPRPDAVVVDPPRRGLDEALIGAILTLAPRRVVYVSCDPGTLARDIARLTGYRLARCAAVDMFPRTANVECVAALEL